MITIVKYTFINDKGQVSYWAYPSAHLYVPGNNKAVWDYTGTGECREVKVSTGLSLKLGAKWVVFAKMSEDDITTLMNLARNENDALNASCAGQISRELARVLRVAQGKESYSFNEIATSGKWGTPFEWKAMWHSIILFFVCAILQVIAYRLTRMKWNTEGAFKISAYILMVGYIYYLYQFFKALC